MSLPTSKSTSAWEMKAPELLEHCVKRLKNIARAMSNLKEDKKALLDEAKSQGINVAALEAIASADEDGKKIEAMAEKMEVINLYLKALGLKPIYEGAADESSHTSSDGPDM